MEVFWWLLAAIILLFAVSLFVVTVALVVAIQLHWFPGVRLRPGRPPRQQSSPLSDAAIASALRPLYDSAAVASARKDADLQIARAVERALNDLK